MAKIDTSTIENYEAMTPEEKLAALESYEYEEPAPPEPVKDNVELQKLKQALSKANSEAADYKKQLRAKQTDEEAKAEQERIEREALAQELESLRKEKTVAKYKAEYLGLGYDEKLADETAAAMAGGEHDVVFANAKKFIEMQKKTIMAEALNRQPELTAGKPITAENIKDKELAELRAYMGLPPIK